MKCKPIRLSRRLTASLLSSMLVFLLFSQAVSAAAASGAKYVGARLPNYQKLIVLRNNDPNINAKLGIGKSHDLKKPDQIDYYINAAIACARKYASDTRQVVIVIAPGTYYPKTGNFSIPSNTYLYAKGATISYRNKNRGCIFTNDKIYRQGEAGNAPVTKSSRNIRIVGGTWDISMYGPTQSYATTSVIRYSNMQNLVIQDVTIKVNRKHHIMEFADIDGLTILGCMISRNDNNSDVQPKEAIQLDVAEDSAFKNCKQTGKGCHKVIIENCKFLNCSRGVGSHNSVGGIIQNPSYTNVTIKNNIFKNLKAEAVFFMHGNGITIYGNKVYGCQRAGVYLEADKNVLVRNNGFDRVTSMTGSRGGTYGTFRAAVAYADVSGLSSTANRLTNTSGGSLLYRYGGGGGDSGSGSSGGIVPPPVPSSLK
ncbi:MAG: right-handed parallel beta-helix repeat-containing protein [Oscillospiraceae bacterium]|nr:right-handed parallel beta-helix repeat-containing protein [Oscillospiraceae bacterium]